MDNNDLYAPRFEYQPEQSSGPSLKTHIIDFVQSVVVIGSIFALIYLFVAQPHKVSGNSMIPTFINGDYILTDKMTYRLSSPKRGEIIVLKNPKDESQDFIKRIIALPGETVMISGGQVLINGQIMIEPYLKNDLLPYAGNFLREDEEIKVPVNKYFVFGDNRNASSDSREWGPITKVEIIGRVFFRYFPLESFGLIKS